MAWLSDTNFQYRTKITVLAAQVAADHTAFPNYLPLNLMNAGFHSHCNQTTAQDIRITTSDGSTEVPREVVSYDAATDTGEVHFKGNIDGDTDTDFYVYYGNAAATDYAVNHANGANNVWDANYMGVWHLNQAVSGNQTDSTANPAVFTPTVYSGGSAFEAGDLVSGQVGKGISLESSKHQYLTTATSVTKLDITGNYTLSGWVKGADWVEGNSFINHGDGAAYLQYYMGVRTDGKADLRSTGGGSIVHDTVLSADTWYYIVGVRSGTNGLLYINAGTPKTGTGFNDPSSRSDALVCGYNTYPPNALFPNAVVDELRVSNSARDANWITTEYNNQNSPATFYTIGAEETNIISTNYLLQYRRSRFPGSITGR